MEMYLESLAAQRVTVANEAVFSKPLSGCTLRILTSTRLKGSRTTAGMGVPRPRRLEGRGILFRRRSLCQGWAHRTAVPRNGGGP